jgi:hypothetical protein
MERLFSPCARWRDIVEQQSRLEDLRFRHEFNNELFRDLNLDVAIEELLSAERGVYIRGLVRCTLC